MRKFLNQIAHFYRKLLYKLQKMSVLNSYTYLKVGNFDTLISYEGHSEIFEIPADENLQNKNSGLILKYKVF